ncbi:MAG TPA: PepSY domain-containing protein [Candidatus Binatia bacterium]|nr:PepSY domain-containing protein [Candidatus Binatia bacterium]
MMANCAVSRRALLRGGLLAGVAMLADVSGVVEVAAVLDAPSVAQAEAQQPASGTGPKPQTSLAQAVRVAEQQTGGRARKAEMDREKGIYVYEIKTVSKDGSAKVHVDPASGSMLRVNRPGLVSSIANIFDRDDQRKDQAAFAQLEASPMALAGAVDSAEKETRGRAVKAALKSQYGSTLFEVSVVKDWIMQRVLVDPATAKVVAVPLPGKHKDDDD